MFAMKGSKKTAFLLLSLLSSASALTFPEGYDPAIRPNSAGVADVVNVSMHILAVRNINEDKHEITLDFFLRTFWVDPRLAGLVEKDTVYVNKLPDIWLPDLFIVNSVDSNYPEKHSRFVKLKSDGSVMHSERLSARLSCPMSFVKFPFDKQTCAMTINSHGYSTVHLLLMWHGMVNEEIPVLDPEYKLSLAEQYSRKDKTPTGEYNNLVLDISIYRSGLRHFIRAMGPSLMFGLFSYYTLFLRIKRNNGTPDEPSEPLGLPPTIGLVRIAINGIMGILVIFTSQINFLGTPKSATITALDIWVGVITIVVFIALFQSIHSYFIQWKRSVLDEKDEGESKVDRIDRILSMAIPIVFAIFLIIYFPIYLT